MSLSTTEVEAALDSMHTPLRRRDVAILQGNKSTLNLDRMDECLKEMLDLIDEFVRLSAGTSPQVALTSIERRVSLTKALLKVGRELRVGIVLAPDALLDRVIAALDGAEADFWACQPPGLIASLLSAEPEISEVLKADGILIWCGDDKSTRMVNARWLEDEDQITAFVTAEPAPGKRCRFCTGVEQPASLELKPIDPDRRGKVDVLVSGLDGKRQVMLNPGFIHTHAPCAPHWNAWVEIARRKFKEAAA
jgi:hypothetical protein